MKRRFFILLMTLLMVFGVCTMAAPEKLSTEDLLTQNARTYIEFDKLKAYGFDLVKEGKTYTVKDEKASLEFTANSNIFKVNGTSFSMDTKTLVKEDKIYIPLRNLFETLNYKVSWDSKTKSVLVEKMEEEKLPIKNDKYTITKEHDKVLSLAPSVTETIFALGGDKLILGRTDYCNFPEDALKLPTVGSMTEPSIEKIISLQPSAVIAQTHYKDEVLEKLKKAKIEVIGLETPKSMEETYESIKTIGKIIDKNYEARALVSTMKSKLSSVARLTKKLNKPTAYIVVGTGQYGEFTHGKDSFMDKILDIAGFKNAPQDAEGFNYTLEKLIKLDPYYILSPNFALETLKNEKPYQGLSAIKEGRLVEIDGDVFSRPSGRLVDEGIKALLKIAHPEILKSIEF